MDRLILRDLRFFAHHGVYAEEHRNGQPFIVSLELETPMAAAARADRLDLAVDYPEVQAVAAAVLAGPPRQLIETLAEEIAARLLQRFPSVAAVTVEVTKPSPPVRFEFAGVAVRIRRVRPGTS
ncbi:MAG: dihydroneopterin aldolase [Verrucomicrobia bacterium]|nr:dihydroneopterin aldolase [Verrucomicrobiota bacterium]